MKRSHGQVLNVTPSPYLADNARNIYYANHYENDDQKISFLSFREFLETIRVPEGREVKYSVFARVRSRSSITRLGRASLSRCELSRRAIFDSSIRVPLRNFDLS